MKTLTLKISTLLIASIGLTCCAKSYDLPPLKPAAAAPAINVAQLKQKYKTGKIIKFQSDSSLYGVITADETCGNLYHELYIKDASGAIHIGMTSGGGLFTGDSIRINLKGALLKEDNQLITVDSINPETQIVKLASGWMVKPIPVTLQQLLNNSAGTNPYQSQLVAIADVYFIKADRGLFFADAITRTTQNRTIQSCDGHTIQVRTSGYSIIAGKTIPSGMGTLTAILSQYGNNYQLILRTLHDVPLYDTICMEPVFLHYKNFDDQSITSGGWSIQNLIGNINWTIGTSGAASPYAKISNYSSNTSPRNTACDTWLISPALLIPKNETAFLNFQYAYDFTGKKVFVYVSEKYQSGKPQLNEWTFLDSITGPAGFNFKSIPPIPIRVQQSESIRIAFRYQGSSSDGSTWELDEIKLTPTE